MTRKAKIVIFWLLVPPALLVLLIPVGIFAVMFLYSPMNPLNDWMFNRDLPEYTRFVNDFKSGKDPPSQMPGRAERVVEAERCNNGTAVVVFLVAGSAVGHWGYMYDDCDIPASSPRHNGRWGFSAAPLKGNWYIWSG
jgi:hypothetical protein